jgi:hypothetical protein
MTQILVICCTGLSAAIGFFVFFKPELTIELQKRFYTLINWRMEPISMTKEIRNTKIMGLFLVFLSLATVIYMAVG